MRESELAHYYFSNFSRRRSWDDSPEYGKSRSLSVDALMRSVIRFAAAGLSLEMNS
jgi:hypothetical protein